MHIFWKWVSCITRQFIAHIKNGIRQFHHQNYNNPKHMCGKSANFIYLKFKSVDSRTYLISTIHMDAYTHRVTLAASRNHWNWCDAMRKFTSKPIHLASRRMNAEHSFQSREDVRAKQKDEETDEEDRKKGKRWKISKAERK